MTEFKIGDLKFKIGDPPSLKAMADKFQKIMPRKRRPNPANLPKNSHEDTKTRSFLNADCADYIDFN